MYPDTRALASRCARQRDCKDATDGLSNVGAVGINVSTTKLRAILDALRTPLPIGIVVSRIPDSAPRHKQHFKLQE